MTSVLLLLQVATAATILGRVVDVEELAVEDVVVVVYDQRFGYAYTYTDEAGQFFIDGLPPNDYRVRALPSFERNLMEQWYGGGFDVCDAQVLELEQEEFSSDIDLSLLTGAAVVGRVFGSEGDAVAGALVTAFLDDDSLSLEARQTYTNSSGRYEVVGLPSFTSKEALYRVQVEAEGYPVQFVPGVYDDAEAVVVGLFGEERRGIVETTLLDGISVGGAVTTPDGLAQEGTVYAYSSSRVVSVPIVDGVYYADELPPGDVLTWAEVDGYGTTYYPNGDRPTEMVACAEGESVEMPLDMPVESKLMGAVKGHGDMSGASVLSYNDTKTVGVGEPVSEDGTFTISGLHSGQYTLYVYGSSVGLTNGYWEEEGEPVVIDVGSASESDHLSVTMPNSSTLTGLASDLYTGDPIYGGWVYAVNAESGESHVGTTDHDGFYQISGLEKGSWVVYATYVAYCAPDLDWATRYYPDQTSESDADILSVDAQSDYQWNPSLPPDRDHDGMDDVWESEHGLDASLDDGSGDLDGDGMTNLDEYLFGTDPEQPDSSEGNVYSTGCGCGSTNGAPHTWVLAFLLLFYRDFRGRRFFAT